MSCWSGCLTPVSIRDPRMSLLARSAKGNLAAFFENQHHVDDADQARPMGGDDDGASVVFEGFDRADERVFAHFVEVGVGFVEDQQHGVAVQRAGEADALRSQAASSEARVAELLGNLEAADAALSAASAAQAASAAAIAQAVMASPVRYDATISPEMATALSGVICKTSEKARRARLNCCRPHETATHRRGFLIVGPCHCQVGV